MRSSWRRRCTTRVIRSACTPIGAMTRSWRPRRRPSIGTRPIRCAASSAGSASGPTTACCCEILRQSRVALIYASNVYYGLLGAELGVPVICRSVGNDVQRPWIAYPYRLGSRVVSHPALERRLHQWYRRWNAPGMAGGRVPSAATRTGAAQRACQSGDPRQQRVHTAAVERGRRGPRSRCGSCPAVSTRSASRRAR